MAKRKPKSCLKDARMGKTHNKRLKGEKEILPLSRSFCGLNFG